MHESLHVIGWLVIGSFNPLSQSDPRAQKYYSFDRFQDKIARKNMNQMLSKMHNIGALMRLISPPANGSRPYGRVHDDKQSPGEFCSRIGDWATACFVPCSK